MRATRRWSRIGFAAVVVALLALHGGCSLIFIERQSVSSPPAITPRCSGSSGPVITDAVMAALYGVGGLALLANSNDESSVEGEQALRTIGLVYAAVAATHAVSGLLGRSWTAECNRARHEHDAWVQEHLQRQAPAPARQPLPARRGPPGGPGAR